MPPEQQSEVAQEVGTIEVTDVDSASQALEQRWQNEDDAVGVSASEETNDEPTQKVAESESLDDTEVESDEIADEESDDVESDQEPEDEEQETSFETLQDFADATDTPIEDLMANIKTTIKVNGEEKEVSLSELKDGYQMESDYRRKTTQLADERREYESNVENVKTELRAKLTQANQMAGVLESQLTQEYNSIDWGQLEANDREEFMYQKQKFQERYQGIQQIQQQAQTQSQAMQQELSEKAQHEQQANLAKEAELMLEAIPQWRDQEVWQKENDSIQSMLGEYGFSQSDINGIGDHRLVKFIRDAMIAKGNTKKIDVAKKKVKTLPKILKPNAKPQKGSMRKKQAQAKRKAYLNSGSTDDLASMLLDRM